MADRSPDPSFADVRGVLFDMDGVLVHSMPQHWRSYEQVLGEAHDVPVAPDQVYSREGGTADDVVKAILADHGIEVGDEEAAKLGRDKQDRFREMGRPPLMDGAAEAVRAVKDRGLQVGVVTGTDRKNVGFLLGDLADGLDGVVSSDDVDHGKPHPEPYRKGCKALGLSPGEVLVVENAPNGIRSARAAGCRVVAVTTTLSTRDLADADAVVGSLKEVLDLL